MLYIVATPIGNLKDISLRALEVLARVEIILCEDTRITTRLLDHYKIKAQRLISYHQHSNDKKVNELVGLIKDKEVALVTDAGTPGISDPGNKIIKTLSDKGIQTGIIPIPGASAMTAALSISGLPTDEFLFLGFIPHKKKRNKFLATVLESKRTVVFYESPYRIIKCLEQLKELDKSKNKQFVVCRELTKKFETIYRGNIEEVLEEVKKDPIKGEYVVVVG
jgi:16S rRNA (cytidine1402-2'-O)-methyltransferase